MNKTIGVTGLRRKFSDIFNEVARRHTLYILTVGTDPKGSCFRTSSTSNTSNWAKRVFWNASINTPGSHGGGQRCLLR